MTDLEERGDRYAKEYLRDNGAEATETVVDTGSDHLVCLAPHGVMRKNTEKQAETFHEIVSEFWPCDVWTFKGTSGDDDESASDLWKVGPTDIPGSYYHFDLFREYIEGTMFGQGAMFRGFSNEGIVLGGKHNTDWLEALAENLHIELPTEVNVEVAGADHKYSGKNPENVINQISLKSVQIVQSKHVREEYWEEVASVLATVHSD